MSEAALIEELARAIEAADSCKGAARSILPIIRAREIAAGERVFYAVQDLLSDAVQSDCENGVRWLNEAAAKKYLREYPDTLAAIEAIRALDIPSILKDEA